MTADQILAVCALLTLIAGGLIFVWKGGQLTQQLESAMEAITDLTTELRESNKSHNTAIDGLTRMLYEMRGSLRVERSSPSRPPLLRDVDDDS